MEKTFYIAIGSTVVDAKLHPAIKTVGRAKQVLFNHGLVPDKCQWIYKDKILEDAEQLAVPSFATISCTSIKKSDPRGFLNIKSILPPQLVKISEDYSRQLIATYQDLKDACDKQRAKNPSCYILERSYKCQFIELRCRGSGRYAYIDIPLVNDSHESLEADLILINNFVKISKSADDQPMVGVFTIIRDPKSCQFVRWQPDRRINPGHYKVVFMNGAAANRLHRNNWSIGYDGEYSITDAFLFRNSSLALDADLSLKSRVQQARCINNGTTSPVALHFEGDENCDPWHVLMRNIAATWDVPIDNVVSIMIGDIKIEDKFDVMSLRADDLVTFGIVEPVVLQIQIVELKLIESIGEGNYGIIYLADWCGLKVAVKKFKSIINNDHVLSEAKALVRLQNKRIVSLIGVTTDPNTNEAMTVTEYMENGSLDDLLVQVLRGSTPMSRSEVIRIAMDVAKGLRYLHQRKIIHRDLKGANVLLYDNKTRAKLADFGTARFLTHSAKANTVIGTLGFMAPEILQNVSYNEKADVYSFGALVYQMLTASTLPIIFSEEDRIAKIKSSIEDQEFQRLIIECCRTDPTRRPNISQVIITLKNTRTSDRTLAVINSNGGVNVFQSIMKILRSD